MMACGLAAATACVNAAASNTSMTTGIAPSLAMASALSAERVVPATSWPAARNSGTSRRPIAPPAPAKRTFTCPHLITDDELATRSRVELPCNATARQFEFQCDRRVVAAQVGALAVRGEAKTHRRLRRRESGDLVEAGSVVDRGIVVDMRRHAD